METLARTAFSRRVLNPPHVLGRKRAPVRRAGEENQPFARAKFDAVVNRAELCAQPLCELHGCPSGVRSGLPGRERPHTQLSLVSDPWFQEGQDKASGGVHAVDSVQAVQYVPGRLAGMVPARFCEIASTAVSPKSGRNGYRFVSEVLCADDLDTIRNPAKGKSLKLSVTMLPALPRTAAARTCSHARIASKIESAPVPVFLDRESGRRHAF